MWRAARPAAFCRPARRSQPSFAFLWPQVRVFLGKGFCCGGVRVLHKALVLVPILAWLGVGALLHQTRGWPAAKLDEPTVVVVPPRPAAAQAPAAPGVVLKVADRSGLARELQKELKRVGCYEGDVTGAWTAPARQAMRRFTERVNAKLPVDEPDLVLLKLVQGQGERVCACGMGPAGTGGTCAGAVAELKAPPAPAPEETTQRATPLIIGAAATATALSRSEPSAATSAATPAASPQLSEDEQRRPRPARQGGPPPPESVYPSRRQPAAAPRRADERPPVVVQSLVRNVQRALDKLGIR